MSQSLFYTPVLKRDYLSGNGTFQQILADVFGEYPISLNLGHSARLRIIATCGWKEAEEIIEALEKYDSIIVGKE